MKQQLPSCLLFPMPITTPMMPMLMLALMLMVSLYC
jgi:hypothetical protein